MCLLQYHQALKHCQVPAIGYASQLTAMLPADIKCVGGSDKRLLVTETTMHRSHPSGKLEATEQSSTSTDDGREHTNGQNGGQKTTSQNDDQTDTYPMSEGDKLNHKKRMIRKRRM